MGDFSSVVKALDYRRASKDTTVNLKPLTLYPSRAIKKIFTRLQLLAPSDFTDDVYELGLLIYQYNVTVGQSFSIGNAGKLLSKVISDEHAFPAGLAGSLTVKWRVGTTVFRYFLDGTRINTMLNRQSNFFPQYSNQLIPSNCVFEYYFNGIITGSAAIQMAEINVETSIYRNPDNAEETEDVLSFNYLSRADVGNVVPLVIPSNQTTLIWESN